MGRKLHEFEGTSKEKEGEKMKTKYKTIKNRFITEFIEKYSDDSNRHFIQVLKKWRDLEK